jgi:hypothetical protein
MVSHLKRCHYHKTLKSRIVILNGEAVPHSVHSSILKMEAGASSEITSHHIQEYSNFYCHCRESLKSHLPFCLNPRINIFFQDVEFFWPLHVFFNL